MLKPTLIAATLGLGLTLAQGVSANNYHPNGNEFATIGIVPEHVTPGHPIVIRPPHRPTRPARPIHRPRPQQHCRSARKVGLLVGQMANSIHEGRRYGDLTNHEVARLNNQQNKIVRKQHAFLADGCLTTHEEKQLLNLIHRAQSAIHHARNNHKRRH